MCLDKKIQQTEAELNRLKDLRDRRDFERYSLSEKRSLSPSAKTNTVSYFPLILAGIVIVLLLAQ